MRRELGRLAVSLALLACLAGARATLFHRRPATPQLPEHDVRLRRDADAGPHSPEQIHVSYAGPGAVTVSWVTWPHEDDAYEAARAALAAATAEAEVAGALAASRRLHAALPAPLAAALERHRHRRRRRRRGARNPDPAGNCEVLDRLDLASAVQWGTAPGNYSAAAAGAFDCYSTTAYLSGALHHVVIGDQEGPLPAATRIYYRVGDPRRGEWSKERSFVTAPAPGALPYALGLLGDLGQTEHSASTLEHLEAQGVDSVLFVGDLSYADGYQPRWDTWGRFVEPAAAGTVWMFTQGNHEIEPANEAPDFLSYTRRFRLPSAPSGSSSPLYYSYEVGGVHVVMLGSYTDYGEGSAQLAWLARDLRGVDRRRTPWVVAAMHTPWYNSNHNHQGDGEEMRVAMEATLYEHGVDAVVAGHVHAYERSVGVYDGEPDPCGPLYINIGDGGNREGLDFDYYKQPEWSAVRDPSYGHAVIEFANATHAEYRWHRNQDGVEEVADVASLVRDPQCRGGGAARLAAKRAARR